MEEKRKNKRFLISGLFLVALMTVTFIFLFREFQPKVIFEAIASANFRILSLGFAAVLLYLFCYALFAWTLLRAIGTKTGIFHCVLYAGMDFYFSAITPSATGGQPVVIYYMKKNGIPTSHASMSTLLHTVVYKLVLLTLNLFAIIFFYHTMVSAGTAFVVLWFVGLGINLLMILVCLLSMLRPRLTFRVGSALVRLLGKLHIFRHPELQIAHFRTVLDEYHEAAKIVKQNKILSVRLFCIIMVQRVSYFSIAYIVYRSMGLSGYSFFYFLAVQALISLAVDSLPLPGGVGANEVAIILMYTNTFGNNETAAGGMLLIRIINYYFPLILCSIATIGSQIFRAISARRSH